MTPFYFGYFLVFIVLTGCFFTIGTFIFHLGKIEIKGIYTTVFAKLVLASTLFVLCVSVFYTKGATILIFLIPLLSFLAYKNWNTINHYNYVKTNVPWKVVLILFIGAISFFIIRLGQIYNSGAVPFTPHGDIVYYSNCIDFLTYFGKENSSIDYIYGSESGTSPYHYYELWFGAGVSRLFGINTATSFVIVTFSLSLFIIWLGFCSVLEYYRTLRFIDALFCFLLVFLTGITFTIYRNIPFMDNIFVFSRNAMNYPKLFPIYIYSICSLLFFIRKKENYGVLCLLALPVVNISTSIGIFAGVFSWYLFSYLLTRNFRPQIYFLSICLVLGIFGFYKFLTVQTNTHVNIGLSDTLHKMMNPSFLKTIFNIHAGTLIQIALIFVPFLILYIVSKQGVSVKKIISNPAIQIVTFVFFYSLLGWAVLHDKLSTVQVFSNVGVTLLSILASLILIQVWIHNSKKINFLSVIVFLFLLVGVRNSFMEYKFKYAQSEKYLSQISGESQKLSSLGSFIFTADDYANIGFSYVANFAIQGSYLIYSDKKTFPLSLSPHSYKLSTDPKLAKIEELCLKNTPFWEYVARQKQKNIFKSLENSQIDFIDKMKIKYLICTKNVKLSSLIKSKILKEIVDQNTGERFYLLD